MFIVIEGLDGSGKSTISRELSKIIGAELLSTPGAKFSKLREQLDEIYRYNYQARQLFYMSTVVNTSDQVRQLLAQERSVIVDRYWASTQVYHRWKSENKHFQLPEIEDYILRPDITVFLNLPFEQRKKRLFDRTMLTAEDNLTLNQSADWELKKLYDDFRNRDIVGNWISIDANKPVNDVISEIYTRLFETP